MLSKRTRSFFEIGMIARFMGVVERRLAEEFVEAREIGDVCAFK